MRVLWIALVWPEPDSSAGGLRTAQLLEALIASGHEVCVSSPCSPNDYRDRLERSRIRTVFYEPNDSAFDEFVLNFMPDVVFFDRFMVEEQFGWRVRAQCPNAVRILDTIDLHFLRRERERLIRDREFVELCAPRPEGFTLCDDALRELAAIFRSDLTLVVSEAELELLRCEFGVPENAVAYLPLFYPTPIHGPTFDERRHFVTIGNFHHAPNRDSCVLLAKFLWPSLRDELGHRGCTNPELHVYGAYPKGDVLRLDDPQNGFRVLGRAEDALQTLAKYRVNLAPLRFGAGLKGKIADGWGAGTPCVTTSIGAEGMHGNLPFGGAVCDNPVEFVRAATELYVDEVLWTRAQGNGNRIIRDRFDGELITRHFAAILNEAVKHRDSRRTKNFLGAMLWYHQHRSTEYFSRWIEEKNRR